MAGLIMNITRFLMPCSRFFIIYKVVFVRFRPRHQGMNVLLIYPEYPATFFSFKHSLHFVSKKAALPPLGLITVASLLPAHWITRLSDLNFTRLQPSDLQWADFVFISSMHIQKDSVEQIIKACKAEQVRIIAGGPLFTHEVFNYPQIDHFILNEAEITILPFVHDVENGKVLKRVYSTTQFADMTRSPVPHYHLLDLKAYASMSLQISRGCPYFCDFCEVTSLLGRKVRIKKAEQVISELETLRKLNWKGSVSIVDDNFIGLKSEIKKHILPAIKYWMIKHKHPFIFNIQSSIAIADDPGLITQMLAAGINSTFIGIETTSEESLKECNKGPNVNRDSLKSVMEIQKAGMLVSGGFIVGFDHDSPSTFDQQIDFIQKSGIVWAMIGLLNAPRNTELYKRLDSENRLITEVSGNNTDFTINFIPKMDLKDLLQGYQSILEHTYSIKSYYFRIRTCLLNLGEPDTKMIRIDRYYIKAFFKAMLIIGIRDKGRGEFWKIIFWTLINRPRFFPYAIMFVICGYHFRKVYGIQESGRIN